MVANKMSEKVMGNSYNPLESGNSTFSFWFKDEMGSI